ncbi:MAG: ABC transporter ATP-binding protein [Myxococcota bacterium]
MPKPIVEVKKATKVYRQGAIEVNALRGLDLTIQQGEFTAIYGPSGSGKSTLLNLIGALDSPTSGEVLLEGQDLGQMSRWQRSAMRRDRIGFVFQAYNLIPVLTAFENAEAVAALKGGDPAERRAKVMKLLDEVGLQGLADRRPFELSGGQQQRVAIVRAIASDPAIVLADEPTANVDSETSEKLLQLMEELNEKRGVTFLFSTHDPAVMDRAHRLVKLVDGRVAEDTAREAVA